MRAAIDPPTTTNGRVITAHEATVKTATVEVKSLTISGKQVTLAVFRQLPEEPLIVDGEDEFPELAGVPWGTVNYHPDCKGAKAHLHVVWQQGDELRRAREFLDVRHTERWDDIESNREDTAWDVALAHVVRDEALPDGYAISCDRMWTPRIALSTPFGAIAYALAEREKGRWEYYGNTFQWMADALPPRSDPYARDRLVREYATRTLTSVATAVAGATEFHRWQVEYQARWQRLLRELAALDQLFIAV